MANAAEYDRPAEIISPKVGGSGNVRFSKASRALKLAFMDQNQTKIVELLREVHVIAIKEIERLNLRIAELENLAPRPTAAPMKATIAIPATVPSVAGKPEIMNEHQVAEYIGMRVATVRRWRLLRKGPSFIKIGSAVRYRRQDVDAWLNSCQTLP